MELLEIISIMGGALYVLAYFLLQNGYYQATSAMYLFINIVAAVFALAGLTMSFNYTVLICNSFWLIITCMTVYRVWNSTQPEA